MSDNMKKIKIESIKKDLTITEIAKRVGIGRELMIYYIKKNDRKVLEKISKILNLEPNFFD